MGKQIRYVTILLCLWSWMAAPTPPAKAFEAAQSPLHEHLKPASDQPTMQYTKLRQALAQYHQIAVDGGWTTIPHGTILKLGVHSERVTMLRARLQVTHDLTPSMASEDADPNDFDAMLEQTVNRFQERHGLAVDGAVGPSTLAALNMPAEARVRQLILNMERLRHQGSTFGDRHIVVNIPSYQLSVMENGQSVLNMRVVVGKLDWQTPTFQATMTHLVVNPYWWVPEGITQREIIPNMRQNPPISCIRIWKYLLRIDTLSP
jgi:murein L,D-transpeptidase YcbB/YkuD